MQFRSDSNTVHSQVCVGPANFKSGPVPQTIAVVYRGGVTYNYVLSHQDANGTFCYTLIAAMRKKKHTMATVPCPSICVFGVGISGPTPCGTPEETQVLISGGEANPYSNQLEASGGTAPYAFVVIDGSLPPGLVMGPDGLISGVPIPFSAGNYVFTVQATDANGCMGAQVFSIQITND